jgi:hypothetical protein
MNELLLVLLLLLLLHAINSGEEKSISNLSVNLDVQDDIIIFEK